MEDSGYAFKTLWQEITNGISAIADAAVKMRNDRMVTIRLEEEGYNERTQETRDAILKRHRGANYASYIILVAVIALAAYLIYTRKK